MKTSWKYIKIIVKQTSKDFGSSGNYQMFDRIEKLFKNKKEAVEYLKENYNGHKRVKMYCDTITGETKQTGWIYCFKNKDWSHNSKWYLQQDWVEITEITEKEIIL